jgi:hypothetical protein
VKRSIFWDITPYNPRKVKYVSEEHSASIFRADNMPSNETSVKAGGKLSEKQAEKWAYRNFRLYRKQDGSGRRQVRKNEPSVSTGSHTQPKEPTEDKNRKISHLLSSWFLGWFIFGP